MVARRSDAALVALALLSITGLVLQLRARAQPDATRTALQASNPERPRPVPRLRARNASPPPAPADLPSCSARLAAVQTEIVGLERSIERNRSIMELFDRAQPNPSLAAEIGATLRPILAAKGVGPDVDLQCRARICCLKPGDPGSFERFLEPFNDALHQQRRMNGGMSWRSPREACFRARATGDAPEAFDIVRDAVAGLHKSGAVEGCQAKFRDQGTLDTRINLVGEEGDMEDAPLGISVRLGGRLAGTPLGNCISTELNRVLDPLQLPADYESGVVFATFPRDPP